MFLEVKNLSKSYQGKKVIDKLSFSLEKGEMLTLLGPSGCGKSTILKAIGGFIKYDGKIFLDNRDITDLPPEKRKVATVFQSFALFPNMTVLENVAYGLKFVSKDKSNNKKKAQAMLKIVGLKGYENRFIGELSGGEKQRVALARSLVLNPDLLLLDEPLSSLDAKLRAQMRGEIRHIQKKFNISSIFVTHDQDEAFEISDRIILLAGGKIMASGSGKEIYEKPKNQFTLDFLGRHNNLGGSLYARPEKVRIIKGGKGAKIVDLVFQGETTDIYLKKDGQTFLATMLNNEEDFSLGEEVGLNYVKTKIGE